MHPPSDLAPNTLFATDFRVVRRLAGGGMGAVYVAEQLSTGNQRALKLMHRDLVQDPRLRERFVQEAKVGALIESDHVVQVIAAGVDAGTGMPWLAMELLEGEDLAASMQRLGPRTPAELGEIFAQLGHALSAAHAVGVVHRDLKPENVFLAVARRAGIPFNLKVLDFGIAKVLAEAKTTATDAIGTPLWMAPEQTDPRGRILPSADVWALGLIAFWLLTGRHYWRAAASQEPGVSALLREILIDPLPAPSRRAAELGCAARIPPELDAWIGKCLQRDPAARHPTAREAAEALERALAGGAATQLPKGIGAAIARDSGAPRVSATVIHDGPPPTMRDAPTTAATPRAPMAWPVGRASRAAPTEHGGPESARAGGGSALRWLVWFALVAGLSFAGVVHGLPLIGFELDPTLLGLETDEPAPPPGAPATAAAPPVAPGTAVPGATVVPDREPGAATPAAAFEAGAADRALAEAAKNAKGCLRLGGPTGSGRVTVTFAPSGEVESALVDVPYAGTAVGSCVVTTFRRARVPPFGGAPAARVAAFSIP